MLPAYMMATRVGHFGNHREIVRDPDQRGSDSAHRGSSSPDDLGLGRDIERRRRLVGNDQVGLVEHRNGDGHALAHAARQLMRISAQTLFRRRDADFRSERDRLARAVARTPLRCAVMASIIWRSMRSKRMQRRHRILEDHGDLLPRTPRSSASSRAGQFLTAKPD